MLTAMSTTINDMIHNVTVDPDGTVTVNLHNTDVLVFVMDVAINPDGAPIRMQNLEQVQSTFGAEMVTEIVEIILTQPDVEDEPDYSVGLHLVENDLGTN